MRADLKEFVRDTLAPERLRRHGYFDEAFVAGLLKEHFDGTHNHRQLLWPLIIFQNWYDTYSR